MVFSIKRLRHMSANQLSCLKSTHLLQCLIWFASWIKISTIRFSLMPQKPSSCLTLFLRFLKSRTSTQIIKLRSPQSWKQQPSRPMAILSSTIEALICSPRIPTYALKSWATAWTKKFWGTRTSMCRSVTPGRFLSSAACIQSRTWSRMTKRLWEYSSHPWSNTPSISLATRRKWLLARSEPLGSLHKT